MAGIGFKLRELLTSDNDVLRLKGAAASFFVTAGPMLFMTLGISTFQSSWLFPTVSTRSEEAFVGTIVYSYLIAWISTGVFELLLTRYFSDLIYLYYLNTIPKLIARSALAGLCLSCGTSAVLATIFKISAPYNVFFILLSGIHGAIYASSIFASATRSYFLIVFSYVFGISVAIALKYCFYFFKITGVVVNLYAWICGQTVVLGVILIALHREFGLWSENPPNVLRYFSARRRYIYLGIVSALATCVDRLTFWFHPMTSTRLEGGFLNYPRYDAGLFMAGLATIPGLTVFLVKVETSFHVAVREEFNSVEQNATYIEISRKAEQLNHIASKSIMDIFLLQTSVAFIILSLSFTSLFTRFDDSVLSAFRWGIVGYAFFLPMVFSNIFMLYFSRVTEVTIIYLVYLLLAVFFTSISGFSASKLHGSGFLLASVFGFLLAFWRMKIVMSKHTVLAFTDYDDSSDVLPTPFNIEQFKQMEQ